MSAHRLIQLGYLLALVGGLAIAYGGAMMALKNRSYAGGRATSSRAARRWPMPLAAA
jgi:hypothetical protein